MAKKPTRSARTKPRVTQSEQERIHAQQALNRAVRREREIQRCSKQLLRLVNTADESLLALANWIQDRALHGGANAGRSAAVSE